MINEDYKGKLLISSPEIADGIFDKSIILICEHDANAVSYTHLRAHET